MGLDIEITFYIFRFNLRKQLLRNKPNQPVYFLLINGIRADITPTVSSFDSFLGIFWRMALKWEDDGQLFSKHL